MSKRMLTEEEWSRNVGSGAYPVSFLHEYAVGLIWDILLHSGRGPVQLPLLDGTFSEDLMDGVDKVIIPDALQSIAGYIPDISLLQDSRPIRCIEIVVTNPMANKKAKAIENLGVELLQIPVRNENELCAIHPRTRQENSWFWAKCNGRDLTFDRAYRRMAADGGWGSSLSTRDISNGQAQADRAISDLMVNLSMCSPEMRRAFVARLRDMDSLESLYPVRPDNPKFKSLQRD